MRLLRLSHNAHALETDAGALLFSYEALTAVRQGARVYVIAGAALSTASRAHVVRFTPQAAAGTWSPTSALDFADRCREVLAGDGAL